MLLCFALISFFLIIFCVLGDKPYLTKYANDKHSQNGEDGILEYIFSVIGVDNKVCIEFGAWDGVFLSNTAALWKYQDWITYLLEIDTEKYLDLLENTKDYPKVFAINEGVGIGENSLENVLIKYKLPFDQVDLLSIDIDSNDFYIFQSLETLRPRVIVCEYNPTLPAELNIYGEYGEPFGASIGALDQVAKSKGYTLVSVTVSNGIWVRDDLVKPLVDEFDVDIRHIKSDIYVTYLITDYKGEYTTVQAKHKDIRQGDFLTFMYGNKLMSENTPRGIQYAIYSGDDSFTAHNFN